MADDSTGDMDLLIDSVSDGYLVPIVSSAFVNDLIFQSHNSVVERWAKDIGYPTAPVPTASLNLPWLAQYFNVQSARDSGSLMAVKQRYIKFLKTEIEGRAKRDWGVAEATFDEAHSQLKNLTVSGLLRKFDRPSLRSETDNPLLYLANMPLPVYLTTSYHDCLEVVLTEIGLRKPRTEICYWNKDLRAIPSVFDQDKSYVPSKDEPLVLHLFGWDKYPQSLVLTEDDCLDFLVNVPGNELAIPKSVKGHLTLSSVAMLGYRLRDWEFRVVFRGVIGALERIQGTRIAIQIPEDDADKPYLEKYLRLVAFDVIWKRPGEFITELHKGWGGAS